MNPVFRVQACFTDFAKRSIGPLLPTPRSSACSAALVQAWWGLPDLEGASALTWDGTGGLASGPPWGMVKVQSPTQLSSRSLRHRRQKPRQHRYKATAEPRRGGPVCLPLPGFAEPCSLAPGQPARESSRPLRAKFSCSDSTRHVSPSPRLQAAVRAWRDAANGALRRR